jgi:hypothetical protein
LTDGALSLKLFTFLLLGVLWSAASAADRPRDDVSEGGEGEGNQEQDANAKRLRAEYVLKALDAVLEGGSNIDLLEIEEETVVANTVAVQAGFNVSGELCNTLRDVGGLLLIVRVYVGHLLINV